MVLSYQDLSTLFKFFDSDNKNYFTYPDFCKITTYKNEELEFKSPFQKKNLHNSAQPNRKDLRKNSSPGWPSISEMRSGQGNNLMKLLVKQSI